MKRDKIISLIFENIIIIFIFLFIFSFLSINFVSNNFLFSFKGGIYFLIISSILCSEILFRLIMFCLYGKYYLYKIKPYYLVDNKFTGYELRHNLNSKNISFRLFEKYAFPPNTKPSFSLLENIDKRVCFTTNNYGLRSSYIKLLPNKENTFRIACSGGSTTVGQGINDNETWPYQLGKEFELNGEDVEIINGGVYGYSSYQELISIKKKLIQFKPKVLLIHQGWNEEFNFSSLDLGKNFKPKQARKYYESYFFFCNNIAFFPRYLLSIILILRKFRRNRLLDGKMQFSNPKRWQVLLNPDYLKAWFENIIEIQKICHKYSIKLFLIKYPSLVNISDSEKNRSTYIKSSRLTSHHAEYQAIAKARIDEMLSLISPYFNIIDADSDFNKFQNKERLNLFSDEIHLNKSGEKLLAKAIHSRLLISNYKSNLKNTFPSSKKLEILKKQIGVNSQFLNIKIRKNISKLNQVSNMKDYTAVHSDRYTTF